MALTFSCRTAFGASNKFLRVVFHFLLSQVFVTSLLSSYFINCYFRSVSLSTYVWTFQLSSCYWFLWTGLAQHMDRATGWGLYLGTAASRNVVCLSTRHCSPSIWSPVVEPHRFFQWSPQDTTNWASWEVSHNAGEAGNAPGAFSTGEPLSLAGHPGSARCHS